MAGKKQLIEKNIFYSFFTRLITLILGIIVPRLLIVSYGSEVNGLLATVTQIFTYLALLEAGIGNSTTNALYNPLDTGDYEEANEVVSEARTYFRKISFIYGLSILAFAIIYPYLTKSTLSRSLITGIILLQGGANFINYYFTAVYTQLLTADGRGYVNHNLTFFASVLNNLIKIVLVLLGFSVIVVQVGYFAVSLVKAPITIGYCKKKYGWLKPYRTKSLARLHERSAFIVHEISTTIFNNTDVFIVSTFCSLAAASVYTVYNLVYSSLTSVLTTANNSLMFILGQNQYKGREKLIYSYDVYATLYSCVTFIVFTTAYILITPFVSLYTRGVEDINYIVTGLPLLFTAINIYSGIRATGALLITVSGHADATKNRSVLEAVINLGSSLILVNYFGIRGVLYGTILALVYRSNDIIIYANKEILKRSPLKEYKMIGIFLLGFVAIFYIKRHITLNISSYLSLVIYGIVILITVTLVYALLAFIANPSLASIIKNLIRKRLKKA